MIITQLDHIGGWAKIASLEIMDATRYLVMGVHCHTGSLKILRAKLNYPNERLFVNFLATRITVRSETFVSLAVSLILSLLITRS